MHFKVRRAYVTLALVALLALLVGACGESEDANEAEAANGDSEFAALYEEVAGLEGEEALEFFQSLPEKGVEGTEVIDFFIDLPLSDANQQIADLFKEEGFERYLKGYPRGTPHDDFKWEQGSGTEIT